MIDIELIEDIYIAIRYIRQGDQLFLIRKMNIMASVKYHYCTDWPRWDTDVGRRVDIILGITPIKDQG